MKRAGEDEKREETEEQVVVTLLFLYLWHCQVTTSQWLQHTAPQSLQQAAQRTELDSAVLHFPKQKSMQSV